MATNYRAVIGSIATSLNRKRPGSWERLKCAIRWDAGPSMDALVLAEHLYRQPAIDEAMRLPDDVKLALVPAGEFSERTAAGIATGVIEELVRRANVADRRSR